MASSVRILWTRSASLTRTTFRSAPMASSSRFLLNRSFSSFVIAAGGCATSSLKAGWVASTSVTPATMLLTEAPNLAQSCSVDQSVSSTTSCRSPATTVSTSARISARMQAVSIGCTTYSSPLRRNCPSWASSANANASSTAWLEAPKPLCRYRVACLSFFIAVETVEGAGGVDVAAVVCCGAKWSGPPLLRGGEAWEGFAVYAAAFPQSKAKVIIARVIARPRSTDSVARERWVCRTKATRFRGDFTLLFSDSVTIEK
mmetsp:Transcript_20915/g.28434  ORF Transcript_20915/g.28434 Transcript_20915/m.28434 type:complete len:259 (-) Transcript_20915:262-1038(-)